jgi:hypothetical protein
MQMALQRRHLTGDLLQFGKRDHADFAVFQRDGVTIVRFRADAVHAENFASHLKAGDLMTAVGGQYLGLEKAQLDRVDRGERIAGMEHRLAARNLLARADQFIDHREFLRGQTHRQAELLQIALRAGGAVPGMQRMVDSALGDLVHISFALGVRCGWRWSSAMVDLR